MVGAGYTTSGDSIIVTAWGANQKLVRCSARSDFLLLLWE
jgi:hypothetical protein